MRMRFIYILLVSYCLILSLSTCESSKNLIGHKITIKTEMNDTITEASFATITLLPYVGDRKDTIADIHGGYIFTDEVYGILLSYVGVYTLYMSKSEVLSVDEVVLEKMEYYPDLNKVNSNNYARKRAIKVIRGIKKWEKWKQNNIK